MTPASIRNRNEVFMGQGHALDIDSLIARLQAIRTEHGNVPVNFRNYMEENVIAPVTTCELDHDQVVLDSWDLPAEELPQT